MGFVSAKSGAGAEVGELKTIKCALASVAGIVQRQALKGWHIPDGRHGTDDLRATPYIKASTQPGAADVENTGGALTVTPTGSTANHTLSSSQMPAHGHTVMTRRNSAGGASERVMAGSGTFGTDYDYLGALSGGGGAHSHGLALNPVSTESPYFVALLLQFTGQRVAGVTP